MDKNSLFRILLLSHGTMMLVLALLLAISTPLWLILPVMIIFTGIIIWQVSSRLNQNYELISKVAKQVAQGDHSVRIPSLQLGEIDSLGKDLNQMLSNLDSTIHHLGVHREELRLVLSSIDDVLWAQNPDGELKWANEAFKELFPLYDDTEKQKLNDVIPYPQLLKLIHPGTLQKGKMMAELELNGHYYLLMGNNNEQARRQVFMLQNIDELRQTEQMKKDFVANLAHELRTPLTAIKGFTDAMLQSSLPENKRFLNIIRNHTQRLIHLISDLEQLIRLEQSPVLEKTDVNLNTFFENLQQILLPQVEAKGLELKIELDKRISRLSCDPFKLEQVFINLVENSLRYTDTGEISISSHVEANELKFVVQDTGLGIEAQHLPRIFERFYVADPARNRSLSGTGLGLAIMKHIVLSHSGRIEVASEPGKGTSFSIWLPVEKSAECW